MALYYRNKTGKGQYLDLSQTDSLMRSLYHFTYKSVTGESLGRQGHADPSMIAASIFKTGDGRFIGLACATQSQFAGLCRAMGREDLLHDSRYSDYFEALRPENAEALRKIVAGWVAGSGCDTVLMHANEQGFAAAEVADDHMICHDPWRRERGSVILFNDAMYGEFVLAGSFAQLSETPARTKWLARPIGYHNRLVLKRFLGMGDEEIRSLEERKIIGYFDDKPGLKPPIYYNLDRDPVYTRGEEAR
jgi:crotonobetainyl-CoA:carnitine CoA-transferase CaiB-like acyl-CoA transferase